MCRKTFLLSLFLSLSLLLTGCGSVLESLGLGKLNEMLNSDPIVCVITAKDGQTLTVEVLAADGHYDQGDTLFVDYAGISGATAISVGDTITFTYDYIHDVTVREDTPYILADAISPTDYTPPETADAVQ